MQLLPVHSYPAVINRLRKHSSDFAINVAHFEATQPSAERVLIVRIRPFACQSDVFTVGVFDVGRVQTNSSDLTKERKNGNVRHFCDERTLLELHVLFHVCRQFQLVLEKRLKANGKKLSLYHAAVSESAEVVPFRNTLA